MELLTTSSIKFMKRCFTFSRFLSFHPYIWNDGWNGPEQNKNRYSWLLFHLNVVISLIHYAFVQVRCIQIQFDPQLSATLKVYMYYMSVFYFGSAVTMLSLLMIRDDFVGFMRQYIHFLRAFQGNKSYIFRSPIAV